MKVGVDAACKTHTTVVSSAARQTGWERFATKLTSRAWQVTTNQFGSRRRSFTTRFAESGQSLCGGRASSAALPTKTTCSRRGTAYWQGSGPWMLVVSAQGRRPLSGSLKNPASDSFICAGLKFGALAQCMLCSKKAMHSGAQTENASHPTWQSWLSVLRLMLVVPSSK